MLIEALNEPLRRGLAMSRTSPSDDLAAAGYTHHGVELDNGRRVQAICRDGIEVARGVHHLDVAGWLAERGELPGPWTAWTAAKVAEYLGDDEGLAVANAHLDALEAELAL